MSEDERFILEPLQLQGAYQIVKRRLRDNRGYLERMFCGHELAQRVGFGTIAQINRTMTHAIGVVRGMHYQDGLGAEAKIITCLRGEIYDVIVDIRRGSSTFLQHVAVSLSAKENIALFVPRGFAHGFQTLQEETELLYLHDNYYAPAHERGVFPLDPALDIKWPLQISQMSERDLKHPYISAEFKGITL